jgi:hypothetical protein
MHSSTCSVTLCGALLAIVAAGCGGAEDPLGGPYGGTTDPVAPNAGNVSAASDGVDASGDDGAASDPSSSSSGGASGGVVHDAGVGSSGSKSSSTGSSSGTASSGSSSGMRSTSGSSSGATSSSGSSGSSSGTSSSGSSSGTTPPPPAAPTWSMIFSAYLSNQSVGGCPRCHSQMNSASGAYSWLSGQRYINGTGSLLAASGSCLSWYGGNMPPGGTRSDAQAVSDLDAWAAAGAKNN